MKAMVFAAGLGTRLKPFTLEHPKALVPVGGVPMLQRVILRLADAGVDEVVVNVHHFAAQITDFLKANNDFGIRIHVSDESDCLLDTGGGILKARRWLDGDSPFIVHNADILTDVPLSEMIGRHLSTCSLATLLVSRRDTSRYLLMDETMRMHGWLNAKSGQVKPAALAGAADSLIPLAFGGVHVMSPEIFSLLEEFHPFLGPFSIIDFYIWACTRRIVSGYAQPAGTMWHDVGKPESLEAAERALVQ